MKIDYIDSGECTALHLAVHEDKKEIIKLLVERVDINIEEKNGWTALHYAVFKSSKEICEILIEHGAEINR